MEGTEAGCEERGRGKRLSDASASRAGAVVLWEWVGWGEFATYSLAALSRTRLGAISN